ncbi:L-threonylcarbamoyladenylate synthase [Comamonas sp. NLF-1-9]|uniref:L-threonylcarbamoyladenylate synthase n=1 Tax=Comamonas sp. NLF-1-9 TaxID=2853163 RepID=UPI001C476B7C|nr:L-threonylcarbamoyladenylate synthase [Comamonas sp. NLF-1-9]QXL84063.1 threonylcarbamoyl-AMP synthase [Comamonas sp. NLF-1-9]
MLLDGTLPASIARAVQALARGELLGLPTETVYGLAANADDGAAVARIFSTKGRPSNHPLIVHVADRAAAGHYAASVPDFAEKLMAAFWPGPLTLILPRRAGVAEAAAGGQDSVGLRCPAHPLAQQLLAACAAHQPPIRGLAAPSANRFGRVSPTTAEHVRQEFGDALLVLDGGACEVGIESTIIDCTRGVPVLLRPGVLDLAALARACGQSILSKEELPTQQPRASGTLLMHYAPQAPLRLMDARQLQTALDLLGGEDARIAVWARTPLRAASSRVLLQPMPDEAGAAAHALFAQLRAFDEAGARLIWVETPPPAAAWDGVRDRLQRAAAAP